MKLELGVGRSLDGPDADQIARSLAGLDWKEDIFAKLSRDQLNYIQATGDHGEGFIVEYQDGSQDQFFQAAGKLDLEAVKRAFVAYSRGDSSWRTALGWQKIDPQTGVKHRGRLALVLGGLVAVGFFIFWLSRFLRVLSGGK